MSNTLEKHLIQKGESIKTAFEKLNQLSSDSILFVVDTNKKLLGSLTDGDIRRGLLKGLSLDKNVEDFIQENTFYLSKNNFDIHQLIAFRVKNIKFIPLVNQNHQVIDIINLRTQQSYLPIDVFLMAGGKGERLRPLTENTPKPLLKIGDKPILEHNINWLKSFGIKNFHISVNYLKEQIITYFENFSKEEISIEFVTENQPLGTIGSVSLASEFKNDYVLIINSDILNNINYEDFFLDFLEKNAALSVATVPYKVNVPYAIFEFENEFIKSLVEKPTYTYYANGGIYLVKKEYLSLIPTHTFYNATDFTEALIAQGKKVISFPIVDYWLDIGKKEDYYKAQEDIKHLKFS